MIEELAERIPAELLPRSGKVFYSGRLAFSVPSALYVLGVNPGGDSSQHESETVGSDTAAVLRSYPDDWSAYRDESWERAAPGTYGMAPRVLHLFAALGFSPGQVPCSNLVFVRSRREGDIGDEMAMLADRCWPFHELAIERLRPKVILCFGKTAGNYLRNKVGANTLHSELVETNNRRWRSQAFAGRNGLMVVVATHPSIADWSAPSTDPTPLIRNVLR
jgi:uracil-DNA glycosylase family 4